MEAVGEDPEPEDEADEEDRQQEEEAEAAAPARAAHGAVSMDRVVEDEKGASFVDL